MAAMQALYDKATLTLPPVARVAYWRAPQGGRATSRGLAGADIVIDASGSFINQSDTVAAAGDINILASSNQCRS